MILASTTDPTLGDYLAALIITAMALGAFYVVWRRDEKGR